MILPISEELKGLSTSLEYVDKESAKRVLELVIEKLEVNINSTIIDILRREPGTGGSIMLPFVSSHRRSNRGPVLGMQITPSSLGVWPWVYEKRIPLWLDNIQDLDKSKDANNKYDDSIVQTKYLWFEKDTDQIVVMPLVFKDNFMGLFSIEFPKNMTIKREMVSSLIDLSKPIATILWKVEVQDQFTEDTNESISKFRNSISGALTTTVLDKSRVGFMARPFITEFELIENLIAEHFKKKQILLSSFQPKSLGGGIVVDDIRSQIESAHFGVIDITNYNNNVLMELGIMYGLRKKIILLVNNRDTADPPFDLRPFQLYRYTIQDGELKLTVPSSNKFMPVEELIKQFIDELMTMPSFANAKPFKV